MQKKIGAINIESGSLVISTPEGIDAYHEDLMEGTNQPYENYPNGYALVINTSNDGTHPIYASYSDDGELLSLTSQLNETQELISSTYDPDDKYKYPCTLWRENLEIGQVRNLITDLKQYCSESIERSAKTSFALLDKPQSLDSITKKQFDALIKQENENNADYKFYVRHTPLKMFDITIWRLKSDVDKNRFGL